MGQLIKTGCLLKMKVFCPQLYGRKIGQSTQPQKL